MEMSMTRQILRAIAYQLGTLCLLLALAQVSSGQTVTPIPRLDLNHFTGVWYEIARYPTRREKHCIGQVVMEIALADKPHRFQYVNSCAIKNNDREATNASGRQNKSGDGKLKLIFLWPFSDEYWVLALGPDDQWALVGSPNHKNLWIFSRTKKMSPEVLTGIEAKATAQGYPIAKLVLTPQASK
jgi:apolipoprotein D and lipocalin family protein